MSKLDPETRALLEDSKLIQDLKHQMAGERHWGVQNFLLGLLAVAAIAALALQWYASIIR